MHLICGASGATLHGSMDTKGYKMLIEVLSGIVQQSVESLLVVDGWLELQRGTISSCKAPLVEQSAGDEHRVRR